MPDVPDEPPEPDEPADPDEPVVPDDPAEPDEPDVPSSPDVPEVPGCPGAPCILTAQELFVPEPVNEFIDTVNAPVPELYDSTVALN